MRGVDSDFVSRATCQRMAESGPPVSVVEVPGCGHAPALTRADQLEPVIAFLKGRRA